MTSPICPSPITETGTESGGRSFMGAPPRGKSGRAGRSTNPDPIRAYKLPAPSAASGLGEGDDPPITHHGVPAERHRLTRQSGTNRSDLEEEAPEAERQLFFALLGGMLLLVLWTGRYAFGFDQQVADVVHLGRSSW